MLARRRNQLGDHPERTAAPTSSSSDGTPNQLAAGVGSEAQGPPPAARHERCRRPKPKPVLARSQLAPRLLPSLSRSLSSRGVVVSFVAANRLGRFGLVPQHSTCCCCAPLYILQDDIEDTIGLCRRRFCLIGLSDLC